MFLGFFLACVDFCEQNLQAGFSTNYARFIHTCCVRRIWWSCEGLTSVHNEYTGWSLKLRHMYNLSLPNLRATLQACLNRLCWVVAPDCMLVTERVLLRVCVRPVLYCTVSYIAACVDASGTVFWDRPRDPDLICVFTHWFEWQFQLNASEWICCLIVT